MDLNSLPAQEEQGKQVGDRINLSNRANLAAEVAGGDRGNITLNTNILTLQRRSQITTNATGTASGGNINLNTDFIVGLQNSDVVARAEQGSGGNIAIAAQGLLGIEPRTELSTASEINASSQLGLNGSIDITNPDVKPDSGLIELPAELLNPNQQVTHTCADSQGSTFVVTGRGGVPANPRQTVERDRLWADLRSPFTQSNRQQNTPRSAAATNALATTPPESTPPEP